MQLYPFQNDGVDALVRRRCVLLADDMGLGKTVQAAVAIRRLVECAAIRRTVVVCPASLCYNWRDELRRWTGGIPAVLYKGPARYGMLEGRAPILIASYDTLVNDLRRATQNGHNFYDIGTDLLVLDEAQHVKNPDSLRARVVSSILAPRRWALTGTPLENHPSELASILRFLYPNDIDTSTWRSVSANIFALRDRCMIRRSKADVGLQLPEKNLAYVPTALTPDQAGEYAAAVERLRESVCSSESPTVVGRQLMAGLQRLRRIAIISDNGESGKMDFLVEEVGEIVERGEKVVVFSSFARLALPRLASRLAAYGALLFTGDMSLEERHAVHKCFIEDSSANVMCASLKAAGFGITWTAASHAYHLDMWWNPQVMRQAEDRIHRIGQSNPVFIKRLIADDTIEEGIRQLLERKSDVFDFVIEDTTTECDSSSTSFSDLLSLINLRKDDLKAVWHRNHSERQ